jgi:small conductance mechanosensitive channel
MLQQVVLAIALFFGPMTHAAAPAKAESAPASTQPSAQVAQPQQAGSESITSIFSKTRMGQLAEGKTRVTLDDVKNPLFWIDTLKDLALALLGFIPRLIVAGLFLIFFWCIYRGVRKLVLGTLAGAGVDESIREMLAHLLKWAIMGFGLVIACNQIGIQIAALLTGVSIIGLAVGFAAQETLANFIAGIVIFWDKPFKVGDFVEIDGTTGQVQRVTFRSTRLLDGAGKIVVFPNTEMLAKKLVNNTSHPLTAVRVVIGIAYTESIDQARSVLLKLIEGDERICKDPKPGVGVAECAANSVNLGLGFWVADEKLEGALKGEYLEKAKKAFDAAGIQMPYPHMQLILEQSPAIEMLAGAAPMQLRAAG